VEKEVDLHKYSYIILTMGHGIFPNYGKQWIKSGEFNRLSHAEKSAVFFPRHKKKVTRNIKSEEEDDSFAKRNNKKK